MVKLRIVVLFIMLLLASVLLGACAPAATPQAPQATPAHTSPPAPPTETQSAPLTTDIPAPTAAPTETPAEPIPEPVSELEPFMAGLMESIGSGNYEAMRNFMGADFYFGMLQSEAGKETPEDAIRLLQGFLGGNNISFATPEETAALLTGFDPLSILGPDVKNPAFLLLKNAGTEGKDGAILYIAQNPDGSYYWYGMLVARGGIYR